MNNLIRVFISSTFLDFSEERTLIQEKVIPELDKFAREHGARYEAVDLRWGITDEAQNDHETLEICLEEIKRSQDISPKPNFIVLLGQRYGTQLPPPKIKASTFEVLLLSASVEDRKTLSELYERDENQLPEAIYVLKPKGKWDKKYSHEIILETLRKLADKSELDESELNQFYMSVTHHEINKGILEVPNAHEHVTIYERTIVDLEQNPSKHLYTDANTLKDKSVSNSILKLKSELKNSNKYFSFKEYEVEFNNLQNKKKYLDNLITQIIDDQKKLIINQINSNIEVSTKLNAPEQNHKFAMDRCKVFTGRETELKTISSYLNDSGSDPLILIGDGGTGKSAILAKSYLNQTKSADINIIRFIGGVPEANELDQILNGIIDEINEKLSIDIKIKLQNDDDYDLFFSSLFAQIPKNKRVNLFLDSLDQIESIGYAKNFSWVPSKLLSNIKVIMSVRENIDLVMLKKTDKKFEYLKIEGLDKNFAIEALRQYLELKDRKLTDSQISSIMDSYVFEKNPLWLRIVSQLSVGFKSSDMINRLPTTIEAILLRFFTELTQPGKHGKHLTSRVLSYIASSKNGLSEDEIQKILGIDKIVREEFNQRSKNIWQHEQLPPIIWSRLRKDLQPYIIENFTENTLVLNFFHREFKDLISKIFVNPINNQDYIIYSGLLVLFNKPNTQFAWFGLLEGNSNDPKLVRSVANQGYCLRKLIGFIRSSDYYFKVLKSFNNNKELLFRTLLLKRDWDLMQSNLEAWNRRGQNVIESFQLPLLEGLKHDLSNFDDMSIYFNFSIDNLDLWNESEMTMLSLLGGKSGKNYTNSFYLRFRDLIKDTSMLKKFYILELPGVHFDKSSRILFYAYIHGFRGDADILKEWILEQSIPIQKLFSFYYKSFTITESANDLVSLSIELQIDKLDEVQYFILWKNIDTIWKNDYLRELLLVKLNSGEHVGLLLCSLSGMNDINDLSNSDDYFDTIKSNLHLFLENADKDHGFSIGHATIISLRFDDSDLSNKCLDITLKTNNSFSASILAPLLKGTLKYKLVDDLYTYWESFNLDDFENSMFDNLSSEDELLLSNSRQIMNLAGKYDDKFLLDLIYENKFLNMKNKEISLLKLISYDSESRTLAQYLLLAHFDVEPEIILSIMKDSLANNSVILLGDALNLLYPSQNYSKLKEAWFIRALDLENLSSIYYFSEYMDHIGKHDLAQELLIYALIIIMCDWKYISSVNSPDSTFMADNTETLEAIAFSLQPNYRKFVSKIQRLPKYIAQQLKQDGKDLDPIPNYDWILNTKSFKELNTNFDSPLLSTSHNQIGARLNALFEERKFRDILDYFETKVSINSNIIDNPITMIVQDRSQELLEYWAHPENSENALALGDLKQLLNLALLAKEKNDLNVYKKFLALAAFTKPVICELLWSDVDPNSYEKKGWLDIDTDKGYGISLEQFTWKNDLFSSLDKYACTASLYLIKTLLDELESDNIDQIKKHDTISQLIELFENIYSRARSIESISLLGEVHYYHAKFYKFLDEINNYNRQLELSAELNFVEAVDELIREGAEANNLMSINSWSLLRESL
jgi:hypothetical protein